MPHRAVPARLMAYRLVSTKALSSQLKLNLVSAQQTTCAISQRPTTALRAATMTSNRAQAGSGHQSTVSAGLVSTVRPSIVASSTPQQQSNSAHPAATAVTSSYKFYKHSKATLSTTDALLGIAIAALDLTPSSRSAVLPRTGNKIADAGNCIAKNNQDLAVYNR